MKLFTKICLIAAAIVGVLGMIGVGVGLALGADEEDLRSFREQGIYLVPSEGIFNLGKQEVVEAPTEEIGNLHGNGSHHADWNHSYGWEYDSSEDIQKLDVEIHHGTVNIYASESEMITVASNYKNIRVEKDGYTLEIEAPNNAEIELYLPAGVLKEIDMEFDSAVVTAKQLEAKEISLSLGAGTFYADRILASYGVELQIGAGEITVDYFDSNALDIECGLGTASLGCEGEAEDYNYTLECGMGVISVDSQNYTGLANEIKIENNAAKRIDVECGMGSVELAFHRTE